MPTAAAMVSAVLKPMPHTSEASRYGSARTTETDASPYFLKIRTASAVDTPTPCRNTITSLMAFCSAQATVIFAVRLGPRPSTSISRPGSSSMMCMMSTPKWATIRSAITGPMPLIRPEPRYRWMPAMVAGSTVV
jgi:hypothetical protein